MMSCSKIAFGFFCKVLWKNPSELFGQPNNWKNHMKGNFPDKTVFQFISDLQWKTKSHCGPCAGERISHEDKLKGSWSVRKTDGFSGNPQSLPASGAIRPIDICRHFDLVYPTWIPLSSGTEVFNLSLKNYPPTNQFLNQVKQTEWPRQEKKRKVDLSGVRNGVFGLFAQERNPALQRKLVNELMKPWRVLRGTANSDCGGRRHVYTNMLCNSALVK